MKTQEEELKELNEWIDSFYKQKIEFMRKPYLRILFFETTLRCNARCEHCGSSCGDIVNKDEITLDEIKHVLKSLADNPKYDEHNIMVNLTGGEPLLRKDLFDIAAYAHSLGFPWGLTSNGFLIDENIVNKMVETGMYSISVSMDGLEETHDKFRRYPGGFKKLVNGIKLLVQKPEIKEVQVTTCVNKKNIDELPSIYSLLLSLGVKNWRIMEVDPIGRAKESKDLILSSSELIHVFDFIEKVRSIDDGMNIEYGGCGHFIGRYYEENIKNRPAYCGAGTLIASVLSNGDIFACPDIERRPEFIQGNIREDDFIEVWENKFKPYRSIRRTCNNKCKKCDEWKLCTGDGFHTWDFEKNEPNFCWKKMVEEYKKECESDSE